MSPRSKGVLLALSFILLLPAIAVVAAPKGPPNISSPTISPATPGPNDQVTVTATVTAGPGSIQNVTVTYTTDAWKKTNTTTLAFYNTTSNLATAHIPAFSTGGLVDYYLVAFDTNGNRAVNNNNGSYFTYSVPAPTPTSTTSMWIEVGVIIAVVGAAASVGLYSLRSKPKQN